jgi:UDP-N-acetylmuramoyl-tripeptide--D-alanyl-D-alanine ligase
VIPLRADELAGCRLVAGEPGAVVTSVVADSRLARPGSLFVALPGERVNGHDFVAHARSRGAVAALCAAHRPSRVDGLALLAAPDPLAALGAVAAQVRGVASCRVLGVAGAAGKTTTKDVLRALCAPHLTVVASERSHNNELGVPLTLCKLDPRTELVVCELGTGAPGELAALCRVASPDAGVLTALGAEHLEFFGSVEGAAREEAALVAALPAGARVALPFGEPLLEPHRRRDLQEISFGLDPRADVHPVGWSTEADGAEVALSACGVRTAFRTNLRGPLQLRALLAAVAGYAALGLPLEAVGAGAARIALSPLRGEERPRVGGGLLISDCYNANPVSMEAALTALAERRAAGGARAVAVLGEMAELGPGAPGWHRRVGRLAAAAGIDLLVGVGPLARHYGEGAGRAVESLWFPALTAAASGLGAVLDPTDIVLLKGSRGAALERLEPTLG